MKKRILITMLSFSLCLSMNAQVMATETFIDDETAAFQSADESNFSDGTETISNNTAGLDDVIALLDGTIELNGITYQYQEDTDSYIVLKGSGQKNVTIPNTVNEKQITAIAPKAFYQDNSLEELTIEIESSLTDKIGESAFEGCLNLKTVKAYGIEEIEKNAFYGCENLTWLGLEYNTCVKSGSFQNCPKLQCLYFAGSLKGDADAFDPDNKIINMAEWHDISLMNSFNIVYFYCYDDPDLVFGLYTQQGYLEYYNETLANCKSGAVGKINISTEPKQNHLITKIGRKAFYKCTDITEVIIPSGIHTIETKAFYGCTGLTKIQIPDSVSNIADDAFAESTNIVIYAKEGSYAAQYAATHGISCVTDEEDELDTPTVPSLIANGNSVTISLPQAVPGAVGYEFVIGGKSSYKGVNLLQKITSKSPKGTFTLIKKGTHYAYARAYKLVNGKKLYSPWSAVNSIKVTATTPSAPLIKKVTVSGSTVTLWVSNTAYALGFDAVLGTGKSSVKPTNYVYSAKNQKQTGKQTKITIKNVKKGTYYLGVHAFNRTGKDNAKVFGNWSKIKKIVVK